MLREDQGGSAPFTSPLYVLWEITQRCDLNCPYCYAKDASEAELTDEVAERIAEELALLKPVHVFFSGGEPLVREELLRRLVEPLRDAGVKCGLITDGTRVNAANATWLKQAFFQIQIGFDGTTAEMHDRIRGRRGAFAAAANALDLLRGGPAELGVVMALHKETVGQILAVANFAIEKGVRHLYLPWMARIGRGAHRPDLSLNVQARLRVVEREVAEVMRRYGTVLHIQVSDPFAFARTMVEAGAPNATLQIRSDGTLAPLQWLPFTGGHVREGIQTVWQHQLADIWNHPEVVSAIEACSSLEELQEMQQIGQVAASVMTAAGPTERMQPDTVLKWCAEPFSRKEGENNWLLVVDGYPFTCNDTAWSVFRRIDGKTPVSRLLGQVQIDSAALNGDDVADLLKPLIEAQLLQVVDATDIKSR